jgi:adenylosuccinate synthase
VVLRYATRVNGLWGLALTKMDVLSGLDTLRICTAYKLDGRTVTELPCDFEDFSRVEPIYEDMPGWPEHLTGARTFDDLPKAAQRYVRRVEEIVGIPVVSISVGAERGETIVLQNPFHN